MSDRGDGKPVEQVGPDVTEFDAYHQGFLDGLEAYAWHKDGGVFVGTTGTTLSRAKLNATSTWNYRPPSDG